MKLNVLLPILPIKKLFHCSNSVPFFSSTGIDVIENSLVLLTAELFHLGSFGSRKPVLPQINYLEAIVTVHLSQYLLCRQITTLMQVCFHYLNVECFFIFLIKSNMVLRVRIDYKFIMLGILINGLLEMLDSLR